MHEPLPTGRQAGDLSDRTVRLVGIPAFGIGIPNVAGLFGPLGPADLPYWLGYVYFIGLSALIWQGNRYFLLKQRAHYDWFNHPIRKVMVLLAANVLYTAPLTITWLWLWYEMAGFPQVDWTAIQIVGLINVICVIFITHIYETVYLIRQREDDLLAVERLDRARAEAELEALKNQIDPHFMFNSLNTLTHLIETQKDQAMAFCDDLADVYRYILRHKSAALVLLSDELAFARSYLALMERRFGRALKVSLPQSPANGAPDRPMADNPMTYRPMADGPMTLRPMADNPLIPPISVQVLLENAVKHNAFSESSPLRVDIFIEGDSLTVESDRRPLPDGPSSSRIGLRNLNERFELLTRRGIAISEDERTFRVTLPLTHVLST